MSKNMYTHLFQKHITNSKLIWWCPGRRLASRSVQKLIVIPKGIFFRTIRAKSLQVGKTAGAFISTRKPFVRPTPKSRR